MQARYLIPVLVVTGLLALLAIGLTLDPRKVPSPLINKPVPEFVLPQLYQPDQMFSHEQLRGDIKLLNVWASWCVACREEHAQIDRLAREFGFTVIGLNYKDKPEDARAWLEKFGNPYSVIAVDLEGHVGIDWGVYGVPETFIVDASGRIRYKHIGPVTAEDINTLILPLIREIRGSEVAS